MTFSDQLKIWRGHRYQKEAADALDVSVRTYESWESGARSPGKITRSELHRRMDANLIKLEMETRGLPKVFKTSKRGSKNRRESRKMSDASILRASLRNHPLQPA